MKPDKNEQFKDGKTFYAPTRKAWRKWLEKNHAKEKSVWLITFNKGTDVDCVSYPESVEEALCFGWIDSVKYKREPGSGYLYFSVRKPKSNWSLSNRERVARLTEQGLIMPAGQAMIDLAKRTGTWEALIPIENGVIPDDLGKAFARNKNALKNFEAFSASARRIILEWLASAKRPETRATRIAEIVSKAAENKKANEYVRKG
jgi:uncharacterized protein YdeI (YjbR/CyaY-like superfamily)